METRNLKLERRFSPDKMQKVNLFETERMFTDIYCLEPGQEQKRHAHQGADKVYFVLEGAGRFHIGDDERDLGPDEIALAPADVEHGVRNEPQNRPWVYVCFASFAVLCELCANVSLFLERIPFSQSSQSTAKLAASGCF